MKNIIFKKFISLFAFLLLINFMAVTAYGDQTDIDSKDRDRNKQITINRNVDGTLEYTYRVMDDIEVKGVNGQFKWFFDVDKELAVKDFKLNLHCRLSPMIIRDISYITIYMNNIPVQSLSLKDSTNSLAMSWVVNIPANMIFTGYNELMIKTHTRISYDECEDDEHIANWMVIDGSTNYVITFDKKNAFNQIADFPRPFVGMYPDDSKGIGVIIPENYSNEELSAALTLIAHMKAERLGYEVKTTLVTAGDQQISGFDSIIYIGGFNNMPGDIKSLVESSADNTTDNAFIYRLTSNDNKPVFIIASENGKSLINAVKALGNSELKKQMTFNSFILSPLTDTETKETKGEDYIYLKSLGINGIKVEGIKRQVTTIGIRIPFNQVLADESSIDLNIRYSDNIDYEKSMVSVYINGIPIGSEKLDAKKRDLHQIKMIIPEECKIYSYYDIRVEFYLIPSGEIT